MSLSTDMQTNYLIPNSPRFSANSRTSSRRIVRKMNLSRIPPYISLLYFDLNLSTPNSPQPIYIVLPCVALG